MTEKLNFRLGPVAAKCAQFVNLVLIREWVNDLLYIFIQTLRDACNLVLGSAHYLSLQRQRRRRQMGQILFTESYLHVMVGCLFSTCCRQLWVCGLEADVLLGHFALTKNLPCLPIGDGDMRLWSMKTLSLTGGWKAKLYTRPVAARSAHVADGTDTHPRVMPHVSGMGYPLQCMLLTALGLVCKWDISKLCMCVLYLSFCSVNYANLLQAWLCSMSSSVYHLWLLTSIQIYHVQRNH